jgi:hypothetical protein
MIPAHWTTALANHLWQSTLLATAAALLARALQKNHAGWLGRPLPRLPGLVYPR